MKYAVVFALLAASASAFAPAAQQQTSSRAVTALNAEKSKALPWMNRPKLLDGTLPGDNGFDPLGLSEINGVGIDLYWLTEAEIKHCRLAMMAAAGFLWVELFGPAPGNEMCTDKNQIKAFWQFWDAHPQYIAASLIFIGILEMVGGIATTTGRESGQRAPGDFGLDPLNIKTKPVDWEKAQLQEIKNGRLAMFAAMGQIVQGVTTDEGAIGNLF
jgi:light-harvesting complex I chlorophyll a/b binding protein 1